MNRISVTALGAGLLTLAMATMLSAADVPLPAACSLISAKDVEQVFKGGAVTVAPQDLKDHGPSCNFWDAKGQGGIVQIMPVEKFSNVQEQAKNWQKSAYVPDPPETISGLGEKAIFFGSLWFIPVGKPFTVNVMVSGNKINRDVTLALAKKLKL